MPFHVIRLPPPPSPARATSTATCTLASLVEHSDGGLTKKGVVYSCLRRHILGRQAKCTFKTRFAKPHRLCGKPCRSVPLPCHNCVIVSCLRHGVSAQVSLTPCPTLTVCPRVSPCRMLFLVRHRSTLVPACLCCVRWEVVVVCHIGTCEVTCRGTCKVT